MKIKFNYIIIGILIITGALYGYYRIHPLNKKVIIGSHTFFIEVAATPQEKELGLGNRKSLKEDWGMIFPYDHKEIYAFWMKGMNFPLDYIWIDGNKIVDLTPDVPIYTNGQLTVVRPVQPADKILEVNAGIIKKYGIRIGDLVSFKD